MTAISPSIRLRLCIEDVLRSRMSLFDGVDALLRLAQELPGLERRHQDAVFYGCRRLLNTLQPLGDTPCVTRDGVCLTAPEPLFTTPYCTRCSASQASTSTSRSSWPLPSAAHASRACLASS
jgi:hypothetical protein